MNNLVTDEEMRMLDRNTSEHFKVPELVLMEQAAAAFVEEFLKYQSNREKPVLVVCGTGNNGADGIAIARLLNQKQIPAKIWIPFPDKKKTPSFQVQEQIYRTYRYPVAESFAETDAGYVIDALFGIGLTRTITGAFADCIGQINQSGIPVVSVDMPSGISAGNGAVMGCAVRADRTITFSFGKVGLFLWPGSEYAGEISVVPMGITEASWLDQTPSLYCMEESDLLYLPKRSSHSNKGSYGRILIIAGSHNMAGAAYLSAKAAYRMGAGLVKILTAESNREIIQTLLPEAVLSTYDAGADQSRIKKATEIMKAPEIREELAWADAVCIGPGLGTSKFSKKMVKQVLSEAGKKQIPLVIDADALNLIAANEELSALFTKQMIITPHLGEMSRLTGKTVAEIQNDLIKTAVCYGNEHQVNCVLKDARSIVHIPDGKTYLNRSGNHGMATAGSGDVLSGIITALLGQGLSPALAAPLGVYVHGLAGNQALQKTGFRGMMAEDIINGLNSLWKRENLS